MIHAYFISRCPPQVDLKIPVDGDDIVEIHFNNLTEAANFLRQFWSAMSPPFLQKLIDYSDEQFREQIINKDARTKIAKVDEKEVVRVMGYQALSERSLEWLVKHTDLKID